MKDSTMKRMVELAKVEAGPFSKVANKSIEQNIVLISKVEPALAAGKYDVQYEDKTNGAWCRIFEKVKKSSTNEEGETTEREVDVLRAQGYSCGREDALLHAVWGAVREEEAAKSVGEKLTKANIKVDDTLRQALESTHIKEGPHAVDHNLDSFKNQV